MERRNSANWGLDGMAVLQLTAALLRIPPERGYNFPHYAALALPLDPVRHLDVDL
jgi:hypothetical protein